jgi:hypothetical protein
LIKFLGKFELQKLHKQFLSRGKVLIDKKIAATAHKIFEYKNLMSMNESLEETLLSKLKVGNKANSEWQNSY